MHVVKIRDDQGIERIYAATLLSQTNDVLTFCFKKQELVVAVKDVLEIVPVFEMPSQKLH